jgi:hypothetical protein
MASLAAGSATAAASKGSHGAAEVSELQLAATTTKPLRVAAEAQLAATVAGPHRRTPDPWRVRSGRMPARRQPTSSRLRRSKGYGRSNMITAPRSTGR